MPTAIAIRQIPGKPGQVYYPLDAITITHPTLGPTDVQVRLHAAALNHRDHFLRQALYPGLAFGIPLLADGCGTVTHTGAQATQWQGKRVVLVPGKGWDSDPEAPENPNGYAILGGTKFYPSGTLAESIVVPASDVEEAPGHLSDAEAAALPLTGLTGWRALVTKSGNAKEGRDILVTGIGGGVALMVLSFAVGMGIRVYVTSSSAEKIDKAKKLGAKGGVSYKEKGWEKTLLGMLPKGKRFDAIIDGAGADVVEKGIKLLKPGGVVVSYGMTVSPKMNFVMGAVLRHIDLRSSTMGSRKEFSDMVRFVAEKKIVPVVSRTVKGLDIPAIDTLFEEMKNGSQFGKLVVEIGSSKSNL